MEREKILKEMGYELPEMVTPLASYLPGLKVDGLIYVSGQLPMVKGKLDHCGKLGGDCSLEKGREAAEICALNCLSVLKSLGGDLDNIERIIKISGFVNSSPDFTAQPAVINGASDLVKGVFGEAGAHSRSAVGVASLPLGACCEVEMIAKLRS